MQGSYLFFGSERFTKGISVLSALIRWSFKKKFRHSLSNSKAYPRLCDLHATYGIALSAHCKTSSAFSVFCKIVITNMPLVSACFLQLPILMSWRLRKFVWEYWTKIWNKIDYKFAFRQKNCSLYMVSISWNFDRSWLTLLKYFFWSVEDVHFNAVE